MKMSFITRLKKFIGIAFIIISVIFSLVGISLIIDKSYGAAFFILLISVILGWSSYLLIFRNKNYYTNSKLITPQLNHNSDSNNNTLADDNPNHFIFTIPSNHPELVRNFEILIKDGFYYCYKIDNDLSIISLRNTRKLRSDIVEFSYTKGCCSECAKRRGRWFSVSGHNLKYPKLDINYKCSCFGIDFDPIYEGISTPTYCPKGMNISKFSNRPFIDDRTQEEINNYNEYIKSIEYEYIKSLDKKEYNKLVELLPEIAPKSFSAYRRMKNTKTANFSDIMSKAYTSGLEIVFHDDIHFKLD